MELSLLNYTAERIGIDPTETYMHASNNTLRVLQEYQFNCSSSNITSLILGIDIRRSNGNFTLFPGVWVFRPNGSGSNTYSLVTDSERTIYYSTSNVSTDTGGYQYPLNPPLPVLSGDLLAVSQPELMISVVRIYSMELDDIKFVSSQNLNIGSSTVNFNDSVDDQLILVYPVTDGYCVNSTNSINASFIKEKALEAQRSQRIPVKRQFFFPEVNASIRNTPEDIELQIWRKIGNTYTKIGSSLANANTMIGTNLYEFIPQTPLQFQEGDIFGIYQSNRFLYDQRYNGPINLRSIGTLNSPPQTISTGELENTSNDFPLVTVEISNMPTISAHPPSVRPSPSPSLPSNKVLITIIPLTVLLILAGVLTAVLLIAITVYCIKRKKKGKTNSRSSPNNDTLSNLRASEKLATSNLSYENPDGVYESILPIPYPQIPLPPIPNDDPDVIVVPYKKSNEGIHAAGLVTTAVCPTAHERDQLNSATIEEHLELLEDEEDLLLKSKPEFFIEEPDYWEPGKDCVSIYEQFSDKKYREVLRENISIAEEIGSGQFGTVFKGVWNSSCGPIDVAIKKLKENFAEEDKVKFLQEGAIMGQFHHPSIIQLHGVITIGVDQ
uniref:Protein kinase domain-containing protein n=1 Tax=Amphimedon queenslandica TaxID=400682 RepID=A0A1X7T7P9_AMPQE